MIFKCSRNNQSVNNDRITFVSIYPSNEYLEIEYHLKNAVYPETIDLFSAVRNGDLSVLKNHQFDFNHKDDNNYNLLHCAARYGQFKIVKYLIKNGTNQLELDNDGLTALHYAAHGGSSDIVKYLIKQKQIAIDVENNKYLTPLLVAAKQGHLDVIKILYSKGANISQRYDDGRNALHFAVQNKSTKCVQYLLKKGLHVNSVDHNGFTPVHSAAENGNTEMLKYLRLCGSKMFAKRYTDNWTVFHFAAHSGSIDCVKYLIDVAGYNVNDGNNDDADTPLHIAAYRDHYELVKYLIACNADTGIIRKDGSTILHSAATGGNINLFEYLSNLKEFQYQGADVKDASGYTPILAAAEGGHLNMIKHLLAKGVPISQTQINGTTLMHSAAYGGNVDCIRYLVETYNLDVNGKSFECVTPLHVAAGEGHFNVLEYLVEMNADLLAKNLNGFTALEILSNRIQDERIKQKCIKCLKLQ